jgi:C-terminal processing protease CtpA/Prc
LWPLEQTVAMLNLDMVGRLREQLTVHGTGTSPAWTTVLDDLDAQGVSLARVPDGFGPSDQSSFYGAQVPVLWFFTGAHEEYHRPADDLGTINGTGAVRVAHLVSTITETIASTGLEIPYAVAPTTQRRAAAFSVGLGVIPEYSFPGPGLRVASVRPGGPADVAGVSAGDVLLQLADREIEDVYGYTAVLSDLEAGVSYPLVYEHEGELHNVTVEPASR